MLWQNRKTICANICVRKTYKIENSQNVHGESMIFQSIPLRMYVFERFIQSMEFALNCDHTDRSVPVLRTHNTRQILNEMKNNM